MWQNCPKLRSILGKNWLERQAGNQLLWQAHPLFNPICFNNPSIKGLESALQITRAETRQDIKKHLRNSVNNWHDLLGFFSEVFVMLRLISKGVNFSYRPGEGGADFIVPAMNNLRIEVTSVQAERWDGNDEATTRWEYSLSIYKTGLLLQLIVSKPAEEFTDSDWIEGFQCFENHLKDKETFEEGKEITLSNRQGATLAEFEVAHVNPNRLLPTHVFPTPQVYGLDIAEGVRKFKSFIIQRIRAKKNQIVPFGIICLDTSGWSWRQSLVRDVDVDSWKYLIHLLREEFKQPLYSSVVGLVIFQKDLSTNDILVLPFGVIPNPNSTLAQKNTKLFRKALDIFAP